MRTLDVSRVVFGCASLSALSTRREVFRLLDTAMAFGIRHFDTARGYGRGFSEKLLGEFLRANRADVMITTKVGMGLTSTSRVPTRVALRLNRLGKLLRGTSTARVSSSSSTSSSSPFPQPASAGRPALLTRPFLEASVEESLRQLGRGRVDVLLLHEVVPEGLEPAGREYLEALQRGGVVGALGIGANADSLRAGYRRESAYTVLQYEASAAEALLASFPDKVHYHHSVLLSRGDRSPVDALADAVRRNPNGKVIFGTRSPHRIREDLVGRD
jgi:aryl-alcohol dehydrogenase-like predicted oxidoreductase